MLRRALAVLVVVPMVLVVVGAPTDAAVVTAFTQIPPIVAGGIALGADLNDAGQVAGSADTGAVAPHAVRWEADGTATDLGVVADGTSSYASAINGSGSVVGSSATTPAGDYQGFVWTPGTGMQGLGVLGPGETTSSAADINDLGWIVGSSPESSSAWVRDPAIGTLVDVGSVPGATIMQMVAINDAGTAIGEAFVGGTVVGFSWTEAGGVAALPLPPGETNFRPTAIGDAGDVLGTVFDLVDGYTTYVMDPAGGFTELVGPAGYPSAFGKALNGHGSVVGFVEDPGGDRSLALWHLTEGTTATVVASPVPGSIDASIDVITDSGRLLVRTNEVVDEEDLERSFLAQLIVVPSPPTNVAFVACSGQLTLSWGPPDFDGYGTVRYRVYSGGNVLTETAATSYTDPRLAGGEINVLAFNEAGESLPSNQILAAACRPDPAPPVTPVIVEPRFAG